jgi:hypothetical protein
MSKYRESRSTCPGFTPGELKINAFLCDSLRQFSFNSAVSVFLDSPERDENQKVPHLLYKMGLTYQ